MDISNNSRVTITTLPENYEPAGDDFDHFYPELVKRMLQIMQDEEGDSKSIVESSHRNPNENYRSLPVPPSPAVIMPPHDDFYRMRNVYYRPNYGRPALPAINRHGFKSGSGTGVFIPLPKDRVGPTGRERRLRGRINNTSE